MLGWIQIDWSMYLVPLFILVAMNGLAWAFFKIIDRINFFKSPMPKIHLKRFQMVTVAMTLVWFVIASFTNGISQ